ncbi:Hypothetical protein, putative [Bodo saltans]|uniref:Uncharacterized protein n=1 Tax=Bodo saltans TaxID=75058 RepID=A0A0S4IP91_BODSA|nr:Hypothetical protein, putative [Bodo saltans]|eukprot:CUE89325.1 Hypothetical protein, putative [Bodo saltans]
MRRRIGIAASPWKSCSRCPNSRETATSWLGSNYFRQFTTGMAVPAITLSGPMSSAMRQASTTAANATERTPAGADSGTNEVRVDCTASSVAIAPRLKEALFHVAPHRFPVQAISEASLYDVRQLVQQFRDDLSSSGTTQCHGSLSESFAFESQYPLPSLPHASVNSTHPPGPSPAAATSASGSTVAETEPQQQPRVWRQQQANPSSSTSSSGSSSSRMNAVVVKSKKTRNVFTIFGSGTVVGFGSGDPNDIVFQRQQQVNPSSSTSSSGSSSRMNAVVVKSKKTRNVFNIFGSGTVVGFGSGDPNDIVFRDLTSQAHHAKAIDEFDIADATGDEFDDLDVADEEVQEADQLLLHHRSLVLAAEVAGLRKLLECYRIDADPLLKLPPGEPLPTATLQFTTMQEIKRRHPDGSGSSHAYHSGDALNLLQISPAIFDFEGTSGYHHYVPPHLDSFQSSSSSSQSQSSLGSFHASGPQPVPSYAETNQFLVLSKPTSSQMLPFAFCLAERLHLKMLEKLLVPVANQATAWKLQMTKAGKPKGVSLHAARKAKAQVLRISARHGKLGLTRHRLFWESHLSTSRGVFHHACSHFEVFTMHDTLRDQLDSLAKTLSYVCDEAHADTNHRLEWIIIALITFELLNAARHAYDHEMEKRLQPSGSH